MTLATNRRCYGTKRLRRTSFCIGQDSRIHVDSGRFGRLAIGLTTTSTVHFVGDLPISEVILLALLPIILAVRGRRVLKPEFKALFFLLGLWLFGQVVSDMYRHTATLDWIRGDAAIIFFGLDIVGLGVLLRKNERRKVIFLAGSAIGSILVTVFNPLSSLKISLGSLGMRSGVITLVLLISCFFLCAAQIHDRGPSHFGYRGRELAAELSQSGWSGF